MSNIDNNYILYDTRSINKLLSIFVLIWSFTLPLIALGFHQLAIISFGIIVFISALISPLLLIAYYVYFLPIAQFIDPSNTIIGLIGYTEVTYLGIIFFVIKFRRSLKNQNKNIKYITLIILFLISYEIILYLKPLLLNIKMEYNFSYILKILVRSFIKYLPFIYLMKFLRLPKVSEVVFISIFLSIATISISMPLTEQIRSIGLLIIETEYFTHEVEGGVVRAMGMYNAGGDTNSVGIFMTISLGFFLAIFEKNKSFIIILGLLFSFMGAIFTASRAAIIILSIIIFIYTARNRVNKGLIIILFTTPIVYFLFENQITNVIQRFYAESTYIHLSANEMGRVGKWLLYLNYFLMSPENIPFGYITPINTYLVPHNYFINIVYHMGIIGLFIFIFILIKIWNKLKINRNILYPYFFLPFVLGVATVNQAGAGIFLWIVSAYVINKK